MKFLTFIFSFVFSANLFAASDADEFVDRLSNLKSISGNFQQILTDEAGEVLQESTGVFKLLRPGYFRWETQEPFPQLLVSDLKKIWLYDPDLEQVTIKDYNSQIEQTPAILFGGDNTVITQHYLIEELSSDHYQLTPKKSQELFKHLYVDFSGDNLKQMTLKDSLGQTTVFAFSNTTYNQIMNPEMFQFTPPVGVDVIASN